MRLMWVFAAMVGLVTVAVALAGATPAGDALGWVVLTYPAESGLRGGADSERRWLVAEGCVVTPASAADRAALRRATRRLAATLEDPAFRALITQKSDWAVRGPNGAWGIDPRAGARALARLDGDGERPTATDVLTYAGGVGCGPAGEATNAYSVPTRAVMLLRRPYLEAQLSGGEDGERRLAATLLHEVLHGLGFLHPHPDGGLDAPAYLSSVPVFFSCAASRWPDRGAIEETCGAGAASVAHR